MVNGTQNVPNKIFDELKKYEGKTFEFIDDALVTPLKDQSSKVKVTFERKSSKVVFNKLAHLRANFLIFHFISKSLKLPGPPF